jgi:hypothetical protein
VDNLLRDHRVFYIPVVKGEEQMKIPQMDYEDVVIYTIPALVTMVWVLCIIAMLLP